MFNERNGHKNGEEGVASGEVQKEARLRAEDGSVRLPSPGLGIAAVVQCKTPLR